METLRSWNEHDRTLGPSGAQTNYIVYFGIFWTILAANVTLLIGWLVAAWLLFFILGPARGILGLLTSIQALELSFFFRRVWHQKHALAGTQLSSTMLQSFLSIFSVPATELSQNKSMFMHASLWELESGQAECGEYMSHSAKITWAPLKIISRMRCQNSWRGHTCHTTFRHRFCLNEQRNAGGSSFTLNNKVAWWVVSCEVLEVRPSCAT